MKIARIRGIDVRIHWTFWILILFYLVSVSRSSGLPEGLIAVAFIMSVFVCVLLHEFGHAIAASWYGIRTKDITLLPIGGVARLERLPDRPIQEFVVALAGPAVNVVIAILLIIPVSLRMLSGTAAPIVELGAGFFAQLMAVNVILVLFNLLPAFPMDGGRVLRSLLAMRWGHLRATQIAARLGRWMAVGFGIWALLSGNMLLLLLAVFVFIAGTAELLQAKVRSLQMPPSDGFSEGNAGTAFNRYGPFVYYTNVQQPADQEVIEADVVDAIDYRKLP
jgi:Zn-dependent protease